MTECRVSQRGNGLEAQEEDTEGGITPPRLEFEPSGIGFRGSAIFWMEGCMPQCLRSCRVMDLTGEVRDGCMLRKENSSGPATRERSREA